MRSPPRKRSEGEEGGWGVCKRLESGAAVLGWRIKARDSEASGIRVGTLGQICLQVAPWDDVPYLEDNPGMRNEEGDPALRPAPRAAGRWRGNHTGARKKGRPTWRRRR